MRLFNDCYIYPWTSYEANNCNTVFIDGEVPVLIDPGHTHLFSRVVENMARDGQAADRTRLILCTHGHPDHMEALQAFDKDILKAIGREEYRYLSEQGRELFLMTGSRVPSKPFQILLKEGTLNLGLKTFRVLLTPGHSPGSICLYWEEKKTLISGDTLFYMGVGRTDLPGGDTAVLGRSIESLSRLDVEFVIPGHGEIIKGREAVQKNFAVVLKEFF
jgi:hydroxyacylglutathione hydrolase